VGFDFFSCYIPSFHFCIETILTPFLVFLYLTWSDQLPLSAHNPSSHLHLPPCSPPTQKPKHESPDVRDPVRRLI